MRKSEIKFTVELDSKNVPDRITWEATESPSGKAEETKAIAIALWDNSQRNTMRIDLWAKDMNTDDMKQFSIETIAGIAETIKTATGDEVMFNEMQALCKRLVKHIESQQQ